jgi:hypothetical protein
MMILLLLTLLRPSPDPSKDWRVVRDAKARCQLFVPQEWSGPTSIAVAPGRKGGAVVHALAREQRFDQAVQQAKSLMRPLATLEERPDRIWYSYDGGQQGTTFWYVAVSGETICTAEVQFSDPGLEATARLIVLSVGPVPNR